jgi:hypothetical protein
MPGPVLFGAFIDKTCNLWEERCDETGACLEYDNAQLSYLILAAGLLFQGKDSSTLFMTIAVIMRGLNGSISNSFFTIGAFLSDSQIHFSNFPLSVLATILYFLSWYFCKSNKPADNGEKSVVTLDDDAGDWERERIQEARNTGSPLIQIRRLDSNDDDVKDIHASQCSLVSLTAQGMGNIARYPSSTLDTQM